LFFFLLLLRDIFSQLLFHDQDIYTLKNEMKVYTVSLLLNLFALFVVSLFYLLISYITRRKKSFPNR
jgi:hypothetical protein